MYKILIIGSKGFIGKACFDYFILNDTFKVFGADVVVDYNQENYFQIDATNSDFSFIFKKYKFDFCINCAGSASVPESIVNPNRDFLLNVYHVVKVLDAIRNESPSCKFIQLSSAAVYGNPEFLPISEDSVLNPQSPYGIHKRQAEELCYMYHQFFGIQSYVLRIFSAYGVGLKKQIFWDLFNKIYKNEEIQLFGTGLETRDFIYVSDLVAIIELIVLKETKSFEIYNIGSGIQSTIKDIADLLISKINSNKILKFSGSNRKGDPLYWQANIEKIKKLGFKQKISLEQGIENYILWAKGYV
jgi:UDP-glucose 4-epimerase